MPLNWDEEDEEELTELEYRKRPGRVLIHEEITAPSGRGTPKSTMTERQEPRRSPPPPVSPTQTASETLSTNPQDSLALHPASSRDRFAAFLIDTLIGFYFYWVSGYILNYFFKTPNLATLHESGGRLAIHWLLTLGALFFYYLLMESVFSATVGKYFCRLRVIEVSGKTPTLGNIFIRNFLRIIDYPLAFLIAVISIESSPYNQRLGDRASNTLVIKKTRRYLPAVNLPHTPLASTLSRVFAEFVDLFFSLLLIYSFILLMSPKHPFISYIIYLNIPFIFIGYYTLLEFLTGTTPGKALFRRQVVMVNGEPPDGTSSLLRNLFRPLDYILGYPLMVLSKKKQRLGDMVADTLVVAVSTSRKALLGSLICIGTVLLIAYFGFSNKNNFIRKDYGLGPVQGIKVLIPSLFKSLKSFSGKLEISIPQKSKTSLSRSNTSTPKAKVPLPESTSQTLKLVEFYLATGPDPAQIQHDKRFRQGDLIYLFFKIDGFELGEKNEASFSEDLKIEGPKGDLIISQPQVIKMVKPIEDKTGGILFANNVDLPKDTPIGQYRILITVYDHTADTQYSFERYFELQ